MIRRIVFLALAVVCASCARDIRPTSSAAASTRVVERVSPLAFEVNAGQAPREYRAIVRTHGYDAAFHRGGVRFALADRRNGAPVTGVAMTFRGADPVEPTPDAPLPGRVNYLRGNDPRAWTVGAPTYARVQYRQLYPGIDAVFYGSDRRLEYDFVVAPHANPARVALTFDGADTLRVTGDGDLVVSAGGHEMVQKRPIAYQDRDGVRTAVEADYAVDAGVVSVKLGDYDRAAPLTIDPMIVMSRSFGGGATDFANKSFFHNGSLYIAGLTCSPDFPIVNAVQPAHHGVNCDGFVTKMNGDATAIVYSTYFGGGNSDEVRGLAVDAAGAVYVAGPTWSTDFPTTAGAYARTHAGDSDAFAAKISPDGRTLVYSTLVGGSGHDYVNHLAVNATGEALFTGDTNSTDYPTTAGAIDRSINGLSDVNITKVAANGASLVYSTYFGGFGYSEVGLGAAFDAAGSAWVVGNTDSPDMPVMGAFQPSMGNDYNAQIGDGFVLKLTPTGSMALSTYFGGDFTDSTFGIALDSTGVYISGGTRSSTVPGAPTPRDVATWEQAGYVAQLAADGSHVIKTRLLDGHGSDLALNLLITRPAGAPLMNVTGWASRDFPTTPDAMQKAPTVWYDGDLFFATLPLDAGGTLAAPSYATMLGGDGMEQFPSLTSDGSDGLFLITTTSGKFPVVNWTAPAPGELDVRIVHLVPPARWTESVAGEIHLYAADATTVGTDWSLEADSTAAAGRRAANVDRGVPKVVTPASNPSSYVEWTFPADAGAYHLWIRGYAADNSYGNDSVYAQFSDSVDASGNKTWRIGEPSATSIILEECSACGVHGWGWSDNGYGTLGPVVRFASGGPHTLRIQSREDGLSIDQIVLSKAEFLNTAPGLAKDDTRVLRRTAAAAPPAGESCTAGEVVLYAATATQKSSWNAIADTTAAGGMRLFNPDAGAPKLSAPEATPTRYFDLQFDADANTDYRLWIRGKALNDYWGNDSVFAQFSDSVTSSNAATWRIGSTSGTRVNLEDCSGCGLKGWGWQDNGYGAAGPLVRFATSGTHTIKVQTSEDGFSIDQIVLSSSKYLNAPPGALKNDTTRLPECAKPPLR
jgi:hypothetical protein